MPCSCAASGTGISRASRRTRKCVPSSRPKRLSLRLPFENCLRHDPAQVIQVPLAARQVLAVEVPHDLDGPSPAVRHEAEGASQNAQPDATASRRLREGEESRERNVTEQMSRHEVDRCTTRRGDRGQTPASHLSGPKTS